MKKVYFLLFGLLSIGFYTNAQDFQGKAFYQSKSTIDMNFEGRQMSEEQKQRIKERMKSAMERSYELSFNRTASIYEQEKKLETPSANAGRGGGFRVAFGGMGGGKYYKNVQSQSYANESEMFGKVFLIKDSLSGWDWKLSSESKKIGNYTVYKATAIKKIDTANFERMQNVFRRGRRGGGQRPNDSIQKDSSDSKGNSLLSRIDTPKDREITAWYTSEIPVNQGPGPYWGLPGLILEVNDGRTAILCSKIVLNPEEKVEIEAPSKGKEVSQKEYDELMAKKMEEMSERFRGGNRRGGGAIRIRG